MAKTFDIETFYKDLVDNKLIIPNGVQGVFGRGHAFEDVLNRFGDLVTRISKGDNAEVMRFPPVIPRKLFETSGYLKSFPHLAGSVFSFQGNETEAQELAARAGRHESWSEFQKMTDVVMTPSACYPVYPTCTGTLPPDGKLVDTVNWVFRHEPSPEPTRLQSFRMRELIKLGSPDVVIEWRNAWLQRGIELLQSLGLPVRSETASDPFFGRGGRMLAANQREQKLKFEVMIPIISEEKPTAVCSFNYHQDHFAKTFDIKTHDGELAQTACLGFGMERVAMALFKTHGFVPSEWPKAVREQLWP